MGATMWIGRCACGFESRNPQASRPTDDCCGNLSCCLVDGLAWARYEVTETVVFVLRGRHGVHIAGSWPTRAEAEERLRRADPHPDQEMRATRIIRRTLHLTRIRAHP